MRVLVAKAINHAFEDGLAFFTILPTAQQDSDRDGSGQAFMHVFVHGVHKLRHPVYRREVPLLLLSWASCSEIASLIEAGSLDEDDVTNTFVALMAENQNPELAAVYLAPQPAAQLQEKLSANGLLLGDVQGHPHDARTDLKSTGWHRSFLLPMYPGGGPPTVCGAEEELAGKLKEEGNAFVKKGRHQEAAAAYRRAVDVILATAGKDNRVVNSNALAVLHSNMAQVFLNMEQWDSALEAAEKALAVDPGHEKSLMRKAKALRGLGQIQQAIAFAEANAKVPAFQSLLDELQQLQSASEA
eukprot:gnl/TRDRNA2_/TRDRNA2_54627_c0_seq2.p1 gnl/TRDRNA2_/TRDRNA2_54627_c0~~gnl/TRDRNA2_/TRDRNA2_54627_c0_seq2.p1  ORF type:complete len:300 (+),score=62.13 gnl/TRDRNA2_/TRDRNA2_54627_c0_seq2:241-1140(+)